MSTMFYQTVPGTTFTRQIQLPIKHEYIKIKFNAVIIQSTTTFLEYNILSNTTTIFSQR
jgi:hypothetical protein